MSKSTPSNFDNYINNATSFAVWVTICSTLRKLVSITKEDAIEIMNDGLKVGYIWGIWCILSKDGCLEINLPSQW